MNNVVTQKIHQETMRSTSPSPSPSPSLRDRTPTKEQAIALEGLARLSTDVFTEKPFGGLVICVTGLSKGEDISNHALTSSPKESADVELRS